MNGTRARLEDGQVKLEIYCPNCYQYMPYDSGIKQFWDYCPQYKDDKRYYQHNHWLYCVKCIRHIVTLVNAENS